MLFLKIREKISPPEGSVSPAASGGRRAVPSSGQRATQPRKSTHFQPDMQDMAHIRGGGWREEGRGEEEEEEEGGEEKVKSGAVPTRSHDYMQHLQTDFFVTLNTLLAMFVHVIRRRRFSGDFFGPMKSRGTWKGACPLSDVFLLIVESKEAKST